MTGLKNVPRRALILHPEGISVQDGDRIDTTQFVASKELTKEEDAYSLLLAVLTIVSMVTYVTNFADYVAVCYLLYHHGRLSWFILTLVPLLVAAIAVNGFSIRWYVHDYQETKGTAPPSSVSHWGLRIVFHIFLLGPVIRYLELLLYGLHSMETFHSADIDYTLLVLQEDRDTALLALIGSFIRSAPQLVLQLYILSQNEVPVGLTTVRAQIVSVSLCMLELALSLTSYHRALRRSIPSKKNMSRTGSALQFIFYFCLIGSRVLTLSAFASEFGLWLMLPCALHWLIMTTWLFFQRTSFCSSADGTARRFDELWFNVIVGIVYIYCFLNVKDEPTRWKYTFYYSLMTIENLTLVILWYTRTNPNVWYHIPLLVAVILGLVLGLIALGVYYRYLHPNKRNEKLLRSNSPT